MVKRALVENQQSLELEDAQEALDSLEEDSDTQETVAVSKPAQFKKPKSTNSKLVKIRFNFPTKNPKYQDSDLYNRSTGIMQIPFDGILAKGEEILVEPEVAEKYVNDKVFIGYVGRGEKTGFGAAQEKPQYLARATIVEE